MTPAAAAAVVRAAVEDAQREEADQPAAVVERITAYLLAEGWVITSRGTTGQLA
ncbi:hypothetical protein ACFT43_05105 [Streptomyces albidoflavus]